MKRKELTLADWAKINRPDGEAVAKMIMETNEIMSDMAAMKWPKRRKSREQSMLDRIARIVGEAKAKQVMRALRKPTRAMLNATFCDEDFETNWRAAIKAGV